jgi:hypothetical protein
MAIFGSKVQITNNDIVHIEEKVTSAYFSDGSSTLLGASIVSSSQTGQSTNETYFFGIANSSTPTVQEFNVAYGNLNGYGALVATDTVSETKAIYKQYESILLPPNEVTGGLFISRNKSTAAVPSAASVVSGPDTEIYVLSARRTNMLDRLNKKSWTIVLSGSSAVEATAPALHLTDDSADDTPTPSPAGDRYNVVSGSAGVISGSGASHKTYGFFYPKLGLVVLSGNELSASIPGANSGSNAVTVFNSGSQRGFGTTTNVDADYKNGLRLVNSLQVLGTKLTFRDEEDQLSAQYFCRIGAGHMNFSNNATFVSGSNNEIRQKSMWENPTSYITQLQLYNAAGDIVAVANLSTPIKKSKTSEVTVKVSLKF